MVKKYTQEDLERVSKEYDDNDDKITEIMKMGKAGSLEHKQLLEIERHLNELDCDIRMSLGFWKDKRRCRSCSEIVKEIAAFHREMNTEVFLEGAFSESSFEEQLAERYKALGVL